MVSTTSLEELNQTALAWLDQHCSLPILRPSKCNREAGRAGKERIPLTWLLFLSQASVEVTRLLWAPPRCPTLGAICWVLDEPNTSNWISFVSTFVLLLHSSGSEHSSALEYNHLHPLRPVPLAGTSHQGREQASQNSWRNLTKDHGPGPASSHREPPSLTKP